MPTGLPAAVVLSETDALTLPLIVLFAVSPISAIIVGAGGKLAASLGLETSAELPGFAPLVMKAPVGSCNSSPFVKPSPSESIAANAADQAWPLAANPFLKALLLVAELGPILP